MKTEENKTATPEARTKTGRAGTAGGGIPDTPAEVLRAEMEAKMAAHGEGAEGEPSVPVVELPEDVEPDEEASDGGESVEDIPLPEGIVGDTAQWMLDRCEKPFRPFAVVSALAVWATLAGRKVRYQNQGTVLYGVVVAATSNGKDAPQSLAASMLRQMGVSGRHIAARFSSWNASIEFLMRCWFHPAALSIVDEGAGYFGSAVGDDKGLLDFLKAAWSCAEGRISPQQRVKKSGAVNLEEIHRPALSMLLAAQPSTLGAAVGTAQLEDGLLPRALWIVRRRFVEELDEENLERSRKLADTEDGARILERGKRLWNWLRGHDADFWDMADLEARPVPKEGAQGDAAEDGRPMQREVWEDAVPFTAEPGAVEIFRDFARRAQARIRPAAEGQEGPMGYLWGKAAENAKRVALILAAARCGATAGPYVIRETEAAWAVRFVEASVYAGIRWARENMADSPFQKRVQRVLGVIRGAGGTVRRSFLTKHLFHQYPAKEIDEALQSLIQSKTVEAVAIPTKGRSAEGYRLVEGGKRRK